MQAFVQVSLQWWVAETEAVVRAQSADVRHHALHQVHPGLRLHLLHEGHGLCRFEQRRKGWLFTHVSVVLRESEPDGTLLDTVIQGADRGATLASRFTSSSVDAQVGTMVEQVWRRPLPWWAGPLGGAFLRWQMLRQLRRWAEEDTFDLEVRGYIPLLFRQAA